MAAAAVDWQLLAQAANLIGCWFYYGGLVLVALPKALLVSAWRSLCLLAGRTQPAHPSATFYEGSVLHVRKAPVRNQFR